MNIWNFIYLNCRESQSGQLPFHFQERFRANFTLWDLSNQRSFSISTSRRGTCHKIMVTLACEHRRIFGFCLGPPRNTGDVWRRFLCSVFKVQNFWAQCLLEACNSKNYCREGRYLFNLPKGLFIWSEGASANRDTRLEGLIHSPPLHATHLTEWVGCVGYLLSGR